ncbi:zinc knuckle protein [Lasius niger]|uniref:Zinc knuckle protein n=1 Tax=Lasius niger TaxID=67767 RepID=A0A0J7KFQ8_LASNI|nr:zinc knuckle protein [Lasius niger]
MASSSRDEKSCRLRIAWDLAERTSQSPALVARPLLAKADKSSWLAAIIQELDDTLPEGRSSAHAVAAQPRPDDEPDELRRFSALNHLLRVTAWCRRWLLRRNTARPPTAAKGLSYPAGVLAASEYSDARLAWIRVVQAEKFKLELKSLSRGTALPNNSTLTKLTPFVDPQGILRVGGRIKHALLAFDEASDNSAFVVSLYVASR